MEEDEEEEEEEEGPPLMVESASVSRPRRIALFVEPSPFASVSAAAELINYLSLGCHFACCVQSLVLVLA